MAEYYLDEDKVIGLAILSVILGIGSGLIVFHFSKDEAYGWGVACIAMAGGLFAMISLAKLAEIVNNYIQGRRR